MTKKRIDDPMADFPPMQPERWYDEPRPYDGPVSLATLRRQLDDRGDEPVQFTSEGRIRR